MRPAPGVLAAFGAHADPVSLPGGEGTSWRAGEIVLKPAGDPRAARWTAGLYRDLSRRRDPGFRVPRPLRAAFGDAATGDWVAADPVTGGWVAWQWLPGEPAAWAGVSPSWPRLIAASRAFHAALAGRPAPAWLGRDGSPWTTGDQVAWGERDPGSILATTPGSLRGQLRSLLAGLRPVRLAGQLAVAAVDALTWSGADPAILNLLDGEPELDQLLARAHVSRLVTEVVLSRGDPDPSTRFDTVARTGEPVTALVMARLALG